MTSSRQSLVLLKRAFPHGPASLHQNAPVPPPPPPAAPPPPEPDPMVGQMQHQLEQSGQELQKLQQQSQEQQQQLAQHKLQAETARAEAQLAKHEAELVRREADIQKQQLEGQEQAMRLKAEAQPHFSPAAQEQLKSVRKRLQTLLNKSASLPQIPPGVSRVSRPVTKALGPVFYGVEGVMGYNTLRDEGRTKAEAATAAGIRTAAGAGGWVGGAALGGKLGAGVGTAIFPGVGTAVGAFAGGLGGSIAAHRGATALTNTDRFVDNDRIYQQAEREMSQRDQAYQAEQSRKVDQEMLGSGPSLQAQNYWGAYAGAPYGQPAHMRGTLDAYHSQRLADPDTWAGQLINAGMPFLSQWLTGGFQPTYGQG